MFHIILILNLGKIPIIIGGTQIMLTEILKVQVAQRKTNHALDFIFRGTT
jgi:tRNA A37 N6-isopentenylltransferase MiaA